MRRRGTVAAAWAVLVSLAVIMGVLALIDRAWTLVRTGPEDDVVRSLDIEIDVQPDGELHVTETYAWDFGEREGLGFYRSLVQRLDVEGDLAHRRAYDHASGIEVTSPSGANDRLVRRDAGDHVVLEIGSPEGSSLTYSGVQTYVITYQVRGVMDSVRGAPGVADRDELYWDVTGHEWDVRIEEVTTTVTGPAEVTGLECWQGPRGSSEPCAAQAGDGAAVFTSTGLDRGEGQTISAQFPAGSVAVEEPVLERRGPLEWLLLSVTEPVWAAVRQHGILVAALVLAGLAALAGWRAWRGRDRYPQDGLPGELPPAETDLGTGMPRWRRPPRVVRFTPPDDLRPAEVGMVWDKRLRPRHLAAIFVDLAARGHLTITELPRENPVRKPDYELSLCYRGARGGVRMRGYESRMLGGIFVRDRRTVRLSLLRREFGQAAQDIRRMLHDEVAEKGIFPEPIDPEEASDDLPLAFAVPAGAATLLLALPYAEFMLGRQLVPTSVSALAGLLGLLSVAVLAVLWLTRHAVRRRAPRGAVAYEQIRGFRHFLETAKGEQLRFEEAEGDLFSRYLPYAMVLGVAERWAQTFDELARARGDVVVPAWYSGDLTASFASLEQVSSSFSNSAGSVASGSFVPTISRGSTSSSGGGFSGSSGGGSSGGGGGGGGGGGR